MRPLAFGVACAVAPSGTALGAQAVPPSGTARADTARAARRADAAIDRWALGAQYLHVGAEPIARRAPASMHVTAARTLGAATPTRGARVEAGWLRASRVTTQAQGATLGISVGVPVGHDGLEPAPGFRSTITLRPGVAAMAGWAEAQTWEPFYSWRGAPNTASAGQTGTERTGVPVRGRTTGAGLALAVDVRLARGVALTGAVQRWAFTGPVIRPNRWATLAGAGVAVRPRALAADARAWWRTAVTPRPAQRRAQAQPVAAGTAAGTRSEGTR